MIPNGIDLAGLPAARGTPGGRTLGFLGRLEAVKNPLFLLDLLAALEGGDHRLVVIGDGPLMGALRARAAALALTDRVELLGSLPRAAALERLAALDVLVVPSLWEGMPLAPLEAMAIGVPVVAHRVGGLPEIIADGRTGLLIDGLDPAGYARAVGRLTDGSALARRDRRPGARGGRAALLLGGRAAGLSRALPQGSGGPMIDRSLNYGRPIVRRFLEAARPYRQVLDLGAGKGADLLAARALQPDCALHAIETFPPNVALLQQQGIAVTALDLERAPLPFADRSIEVVIANQILEHTKEVFWIWHEIARVLAPGGQLILGVPNLASAHNRLLLLLGRQPSVIKTASAHVRGFTRPDLLQFLETACPGVFALRDHAGANFYPLPPWLAQPLARALPESSLGVVPAAPKAGRVSGRVHRLSGARPARNQFLHRPVLDLTTALRLGPSRLSLATKSSLANSKRSTYFRASCTPRC